MLKDIHPFGMVASLLRQPIGVFYFMQNTYTTQTTVNKNICTIAVYMNHKWWHDYEFHTDDLYMIKGRNIIIDIACKNWGTPENIQEIHNSILKHLLSK
jgi:hypothetical protein